jgi:hypothetical protein
MSGALTIQINELTGMDPADAPSIHHFPALPPPATGGGPTPPYPILTEELAYQPSPLAGTGGGVAGRSGVAGSRSVGPIVNRALQDVLGWKIKPDDASGFLGALNQSFKLQMAEGTVVSTWTPRSYAVQADLSSGLITGAQASIYTMAKTLLEQMLPLIDGLTPLDPASDVADVDAIKQLATSQLNNLVSEFGYLGGPRVMRVHQYFQMLLGVRLDLSLGTSGSPPREKLQITSQKPPPDSPISKWSAGHQLPPDQWTNPDFVLGSLGDLRDELGLSETIRPSYVNTIADEQNVTNFRIVVDYTNSLLNAWQNNIAFFIGTGTPFLGTQLVGISRQLGVIGETVDEVRFVLDSVFIGPAQRETLQLNFKSLPHGLAALPPIYLEDLLSWMQNFVGAEAQEVIQNGGKLGLGEDFIAMIRQLFNQAHGFYLIAQAHTGSAISTDRVQQSIYKLCKQLEELYNLAAPVSVTYIAPRP